MNSYDKQLQQVFRNHYQIRRILGKGGMAAVYEARDLKTDQKVALKVIHPHLINDSEAVERFKLEAKSAASLSHPHIISIHDFGKVGDVVYMSLEFLEGEDLAQYLLRKGQLNLSELEELIEKLLPALAAIHEKGIIHRDIKTANIFMDKQKGPLLTDFGIAALKEGGKQITLPGTVLGTPEFMSPEQANGEAIDHRSDLYSFGIVIYHCLSGEVPFKGGNPISTINQVLNTLPSPFKPKLSIPNKIQEIILKLLEKDKNQRYPSASDTLQAFNSAFKRPNQEAKKFLTHYNFLNLQEKSSFLTQAPNSIINLNTYPKELSFIKSLLRYQEEISDKSLQNIKFNTFPNSKYLEGTLSLNLRDLPTFLAKPLSSLPNMGNLLIEKVTANLTAIKIESAQDLYTFLETYNWALSHCDANHDNPSWEIQANSKKNLIKTKNFAQSFLVQSFENIYNPEQCLKNTKILVNALNIAPPPIVDEYFNLAHKVSYLKDELNAFNSKANSEKAISQVIPSLPSEHLELLKHYNKEINYIKSSLYNTVNSNPFKHERSISGVKRALFLSLSPYVNNNLFAQYYDYFKHNVYSYKVRNNQPLYRYTSKSFPLSKNQYYNWERDIKRILDTYDQGCREPEIIKNLVHFISKFWLVPLANQS